MPSPPASIPNWEARAFRKPSRSHSSGDLFSETWVSSLPVEDLLDQILDVRFEVLALEDILPLGVHGHPLLVHDVVVFEKVLADGEVVALDLLLGPLDGLGDHRVLNGHALGHPDAGHQSLDAVASENPHQVVLEAQVEAGRSGIALAPGPAAELVVDAAGFMTLGAENVESAQTDDAVVFLADGFSGLGPGVFELFGLRLGRVDAGAAKGFPGDGLGISAEENIDAAAGHVGRDRHRSRPAGLGDDPGLLLVILGVEDDVLDALAPELAAPRAPISRSTSSRRGRGGRSRSGRRFPPGRRSIFLRRPVDDVGILDADERLVGRDFDHVQPVDMPEFLGLGRRGSGHPGQLLIHPEIILEGDRGQGLVFLLDPDSFLGLQSLVQTVAVAAARA